MQYAYNMSTPMSTIDVNIAAKFIPVIDFNIHSRFILISPRNTASYNKTIAVKYGDDSLTQCASFQPGAVLQVSVHNYRELEAVHMHENIVP